MEIFTDLGIVKLSKNRRKRISDLHSDLIIKFHSVGDKLYVYTKSQITEQQKLGIISDLKSLSDGPMGRAQDKIDFSSHPLSKISPAQAESWVDSNVTDLASAKVALKNLAKAVVYLIRRGDLNA